MADTFRDDTNALAAAFQEFDWTAEEKHVADLSLEQGSSTPFSPRFQQLQDLEDEWLTKHATDPTTGELRPDRLQPWQEFRERNFGRQLTSVLGTAKKRTGELVASGEAGLARTKTLLYAVGLPSMYGTSVLSGATLGLLEPRTWDALREVDRAYQLMEEEAPLTSAIAGGTGEVMGAVVGPISAAAKLVKGAKAAFVAKAPALALALKSAQVGKGVLPLAARGVAAGVEAGAVGATYGAGLGAAEQLRIAIDEQEGDVDLAKIPKTMAHEALMWGTLGGITHGVHELLGAALARVGTPWPALTQDLRQVTETLAGAGVLGAASAAAAEEGERSQAFLATFVPMAIAGHAQPRAAAVEAHQERMRDHDLRIGAARRAMREAEGWARGPERDRRVAAARQALDGARVARVREHAEHQEALTSPDNILAAQVDQQRRRQVANARLAIGAMRSPLLDLQQSRMLLPAAEQHAASLASTPGLEFDAATARVNDLRRRISVNEQELQQLRNVEVGYAIEGHTWMDWPGRVAGENVLFSRFEAVGDKGLFNAHGTRPNGKKVAVNSADVRFLDLQIPTSAEAVKGMPREVRQDLALAAKRVADVPAIAETRAWVLSDRVRVSPATAPGGGPATFTSGGGPPTTAQAPRALLEPENPPQAFGPQQEHIYGPVQPPPVQEPRRMLEELSAVPAERFRAPAAGPAEVVRGERAVGSELGQYGPPQMETAPFGPRQEHIYGPVQEETGPFGPQRQAPVDPVRQQLDQAAAELSGGIFPASSVQLPGAAGEPAGPGLPVGEVSAKAPASSPQRQLNVRYGPKLDIAEGEGGLDLYRRLATRRPPPAHKLQPAVTSSAEMAALMEAGMIEVPEGLAPQDFGPKGSFRPGRPGLGGGVIQDLGEIPPEVTPGQVLGRGRRPSEVWAALGLTESQVTKLRRLAAGEGGRGGTPAKVAAALLELIPPGHQADPGSGNFIARLTKKPELLVFDPKLRASTKLSGGALGRAVIELFANKANVPSRYPDTLESLRPEVPRVPREPGAPRGAGLEEPPAAAVPEIAPEPARPGLSLKEALDREEMPFDTAKRSGSRTVIVPAHGASVEADYVFAPVALAVPSHDVAKFQPRPDYPQELQPRGTASTPFAARVERMYQELVENPEKASLLVNSDPTPTGGPPGADAGTGIIVFGNARAALMQLAYARRNESPAWKHLQDAMRARAGDFGLRPEDLDPDMGLFRSIRARADAPEVAELARVSNFAPTEEMSLLDRAAHLALPEDIGSRLAASPELSLGEYLRSSAGRSLSDAVMESLPPAARRRFFDEAGNPTHEGRQLVTNAYLLQLVPREVVASLPEGRADQLARALPQLAELARSNVSPEWDIRDALYEAMQLATRGEPLPGTTAYQQKYDQLQLTGGRLTPPPKVVQGLVRFLEEHSRSPTALRGALTGYVGAMHREGQGLVQQGLFGGEAVAGPLAAARGAFGDVFFPGTPETFQIRAKRGEAGRVLLPDVAAVARRVRAVFAGIGAVRRRLMTRLYGGDSGRAELAAAAAYAPEIRDQVERVFRLQARDQVLREMASSGSPPIHAAAVRGIWEGRTLEQLRDSLLPGGTTIQMRDVVARASLEALAAGLTVRGPGAYSPEQITASAAALKSAALAKSLRAEYSVHDMIEDALARRRRGEPVKDLNILDKLFRDTYRTTAFEVAAPLDRMSSELATQHASIDRRVARIEKLLKRIPGGDSPYEKLHESGRVPDAEARAYDAADALLRRDGNAARVGRVEEFIANTRRELNAQAQGAGDDWFEVVQLARDIFHEVRQTSRERGRELSDRIGEMMYAPHLGFGAPGGRILPWGQLPEFFKRTVNKRVWARFAQHREGALGYTPDLVGALRSYIGPMLRKIHVEGVFQDAYTNLVTGERMPATPAFRAVFGEWSNFTRGIGLGGHRVDRAFAADQAGTRRLADNLEGNRIAEEWNRIADRRYEGDKDLAITSTAAALERLLDVNGNSVLDSLRTAELRSDIRRLSKELDATPGAPGPTAEILAAQRELGRQLRGQYYFMRDPRPMKPGDTSFRIRLTPGDGRDIEIPFFDARGNSNLGRFSVRRSGLNYLAKLGAVGPLAEAESRIDFLKTGSFGGTHADAAMRIIDKATRRLRSVGYSMALGVWNPAPAVDNYTGGLLMLHHEVGPRSALESVVLFERARFGKEPELSEALRRSGILDEPGLGTEQTFSPRGAQGALARSQFALFRASEAEIRGPSFIAGWRRYMTYARDVHRDFLAEHQLKPGDVLVRYGKKLYKEDFLPDGQGGGENVRIEIRDPDAFLATLDPNQPRTNRRIEVDQLEAERISTADMWGRATVAKTQFNYSLAITPRAFNNPLGQAFFMLNQWPIRALDMFSRAARQAREGDSSKLTRWLLATAAVSAASTWLNWDFSSAVGIRPSDSWPLKDNMWLQDDEGLGAEVLRETHLPVAAPFSMGTIPLWEMAKGWSSFTWGALNMDPTNPLPQDPDVANRLAQWYSAFQDLPRGQQGFIVPKHLMDLLSFAAATPDPETGRRGVRFGPGQHEVYETTGPEHLAELLLPGSPKEKYDFIRRSNVRRMREEQSRAAAERANQFQLESSLTEGEMGSTGVSLIDQARRFAQPALAENAAAIREQFGLSEMSPAELARRKGRLNLQAEVEAIAEQTALQRREKAFLDWLLNERPGAGEALASLYRVFGETGTAWRSNMREISDRLGRGEGLAATRRIEALRRKLVRAAAGEPLDWEELATLVPR